MANANVTPTIPPEAVLAQSAVAVSHTGDTSETILATIAVPANAIGKNGQLMIRGLVSCTNSANNKIFRVRFGASGSGTGGSQLGAATLTTSTSGQITDQIGNRTATNSQVGYSNINGTTASAGATTATIDTTQATEVNITGQLALGSETITLESYQVLLYYAA